MKQLVLAFGALVASACATTGVEEPAYNLLLSEGSFEVRDYAPTILAETTVDGDAVGSRFAGFGPLADYIFAKDRKGEEIAMTAPVTQAPREKIEMTAPVTQKSEAGKWTVGFTMPAGYTMATLPKPGNPAVTLVEQPGRKMAVLSFSGLAGNTMMERKKNQLMEKVSSSGYVAKGEPVFAFYDPPWTLPFLRRNEVMIEIAQR
ncbi:MAG TPA: heme-binding protein [Hyphomonadaceae bacterium]|nr:heme-binding protein [Hyphomonadaceae bacterium]HPI47227.1 heme-binding protein [Hyphomonadaceae bacterium]